jgi:hypothetical protein
MIGAHQMTWRISLDRAWRSGSLRRKFETECGLQPLADTEEGRQQQTFSGDVQVYHDRFLLWATTYLGLEDQAPPDIRQRLSSKG